MTDKYCAKKKCLKVAVASLAVDYDVDTELYNPEMRNDKYIIWYCSKHFIQERAKKTDTNANMRLQID